jgi:N-acetylneuraminic acid mutarotase
MEVSRLHGLRDAAGGEHAVVFFESSVADYQVLEKGLASGTDAVVLDGGSDGLRQMAAILTGRHDLTSIGVVAHGAPGELALGTATLDEYSLGSYKRELAVIGSALAPGGELDLWSCDVAAGQSGRSLALDLVTATGAGVAASDHLVGPAALGGTWQLDVRVKGALGQVPFAAAALGDFHELLGTWSSAASMAAMRGLHTATLLTNGQVLVTGSFDGSAALSSAELYDPVSNTWSSAGSMATARGAHTATLLPNGMVLVAGGDDGSGAALSSAELYDPVSNSWSATGSMATARYNFTATLLTNGKVLVAGGWDGSSADLSSAELYDPVSGSWSAAGSMAAARNLHTATLLPNGKVLVTGGYDGSAALSSAELYDPVSNSWSAAASMATGRFEQRGTLLPNGQVLVTGGWDGSTAFSSAELYDPVSDSWSAAGSMAMARYDHTVTLLPNGKVLIAGGNDGSAALSSAELYDPASNSWSVTGSMATARFRHTATLLTNGQVLVAGGYSPTLSSAELYDPTGANPSLSTIAAAPTTIPVGGTATITLTAKDDSGNTMTSGGVPFSFGASPPLPPPGNALSFNGSSDFVTVPTSPSLNPTSQITVEAWIKPNAIDASYDGILGTWDDVSGNNRTYLLWINNGKVEFYVSHTGSDYPSVASVTTLQPGTWYHLAGTFDGTDLKLYINGSLEATTNSPGTINTNSSPFTIGRTDGLSRTNNYFNGIIGQVSVWNIARTQSAIQATLGQALAGNETGLADYWPMDEGTGVTLFDKAAQLANGSLGGGVAADQPAWYAVNLPAGTGSGTFSNLTDNQNGTYTATFTATTPGHVTITASLNGQPVASTLPTVTILSPTPLFDVNGFPSPQTASVAGQFTVTAENTDFTTNTAYTGTVHFTSTDPQAVLPPDYTFTAADQGVHIFSAAFNTVGQQSLTATDSHTSAITGVQGDIQITPHAVAVPAGVVSWWPAEGNAVDIVRGNNGTLVGGASFAPGEVGQAFNLNGPGQSIAVRGPTSVSGPRTIEGWVFPRANATNLGLPILTSGTTFAGDFFGIEGAVSLQTAQPYDLYVDHWGSALSASTVAVTPNAWNYVAVTYDGTKISFYVNGQAAGSVSGKFFNYSNMNTFRIGGNTIGGSTTTTSFHGEIDELTLYNRALSLQEIQSIFQAGHAGKDQSSLTGRPGPTNHFQVTAPATATPGSPINITVTALDAHNNPTGVGYTGTVHFTSSDSSASLPADATLTNGTGTFAVTLHAGGVATISVSDTALNGVLGTSNPITLTQSSAAYFKVSAPATATTGTPLTVTITAVDVSGNAVTGYTGTVHLTSSDSAAVFASQDVPLTSGVGTFQVTLNTAGSQTITASDVASLTSPPLITGTSAAISTRGLVVSAFTPAADGFTATFSKAFDPSKLTLYGSGLSTVQDVTVVGAHNGPITGTVYVDPSKQSITFKATESALETFFSTAVLPDDTYTVTLVSGTSNGFGDGSAGLDGAGNAGHANYTTTFTTANQSKPILSLPDFARGPDGAHNIQIPNDVGHGIPVTLTNATTVTATLFSLKYNPALLTVTGASSADATTGGTLTLVGTPTIIDPTHATANFQYTSSTAQNGTVVLGDIVASVPNSAASTYQAKELLALSSISVNGSPFTGVAASAVHADAYFGDVTGNGSIDAVDVATANNVARGASTGFTAYTLLDPAIIGDVAGDISVDAGDVSTLAAYLSQLPTPKIPAIPTGLTITPVGPDPTLSLRGEGPGARGEQNGNSLVPVSVQLDHPHPAGSIGMTEAVLALTYNPSLLSIAAADITLGSTPSQGTGWQLNSYIDAASGQIAIVLYSTTPIASAQAGSLVNLAFHVIPQAGRHIRRGDVGSVRLVNAVTVDGHEYTTQVDDAQGQFVLSPGVDEVTFTARGGRAGALLVTKGTRPRR